MAGRRFFQISIRTLLILTTLIAIALAYFNRIRQRVQEQEIAAARVIALGGKVSVRPTFQVWPRFRDAIGKEYFQEVFTVDLDDSLVTDADLEHIVRLQGLSSLSIRGLPPDSVSSYQYFRRGPPHNPNKLPSQISSTGIRQLGPKEKLQIARLAYNPIADDAMDTIASWQKLRVLDLQATNVTSRGIQCLEVLGQLKVLNLADTAIDDMAVPVLCQMRSLQELEVSKTKISGRGLMRLREELPTCKLNGSLLDLSSGVDSDAENMRWKEITRPMWTLSRNEELRLLILAGTAVTDLHLKDLDRLEHTDVIDLRHTQVTKAGVDALQRALPNCTILW